MTKKHMAQTKQDIDMALMEMETETKGVSDLMVNLMISGKKRPRDMSQVGSDEPDRKTMAEVKSVLQHKVDKQGRWSFLLMFKGSSEWVAEKDCQCETLIREYLAQKTPNVKTVYVFCRVSTKSQAGPTHVSLGAQESRIMTTVNQLYGNDRNIRVKTYKISASAYKGIPKQLLQIGESARDGDTIMIYRVDRLSRNIVTYLSFLDGLHERGVRIFAQDEGLWYHQRKLDFIQGILDANKESELISKRVRLSLHARRERGDECFGGTSYGWMMVRDPKGVIRKRKNPQEQKIIERIRKMLSAGEWEGYIAETFNREGLTKRGRKWTVDSVSTAYCSSLRA